MQINFRKIGKELKSWHPIVRNGWYIKFSIVQGNILLFFTSTYTSQTIVRFFPNEDTAVEFINFMVSQDPEEEIMDY